MTLYAAKVMCQCGDNVVWHYGATVVTVTSLWYTVVSMRCRCGHCDATVVPLWRYGGHCGVTVVCHCGAPMVPMWCHSGVLLWSHCKKYMRVGDTDSD